MFAQIGTLISYVVNTPTWVLTTTRILPSSQFITWRQAGSVPVLKIDVGLRNRFTVLHQPLSLLVTSIN